MKFLGLVPLLCAPLFAQQPDSARADTARRLAPIVVVGSILRIGPAVGAAIPARVSVLDSARTRSWKPRTLAHLLVGGTGLSTYDDLGSESKVTLVSRGFTASPVVGLPQGLSVLLDGIPVNEPDAGQVNLDLLPLEHLQQVEVLNGSASLLGPHSLAGAVNLVTRYGEAANTEVELGAGSHASRSLRLSTANASGPWTLYVGGTVADNGGWRQLTEANNRQALANLGRQGASGGVRLQLLAASSYAQTAGSLPLSVFALRPDSNLSSGDFEDISQFHAALAGFRQRGAHSTSASFYARRSSAERFNVNQINDPDVRSFSDNLSLGANADWTFHARALGPTTLRLGGGASANRSRVQIYAERLDPGLTTDVESPIAKADAYATLEHVRERIVLSAGARFDRVRIPFRNRIDPARDTTSVFHRLSPRVGVSFPIRAGAIYASWGQSFRAPALIELACADPNEPCPLPFALGDDPPLDPVVVNTLEAGTRLARGPVSLFASVYRANVRDDIFLFPYDEAGEPEGSTIDGFFANIPATRREGVELGGSAYLGGGTVSANYAWTRATFRSGGFELFSIREEAGGENEIEVGDRLPLVPEHTLNLEGTVPIARVAWAGLSARHMGERFLRGDEANEEAPLDGFWTTDVNAGMRARGWVVRLVARNVFGDTHASFGTFNLNQGAGNTLERFLTPGMPRTYSLSLGRSW